MKPDDLTTDEQAMETNKRLIVLLDDIEQSIREVREIIVVPDPVEKIQASVEEAREILNGDEGKADRA